MKITDINQLDFNKLYTVTDYLNWKFSERLELIKGRIYKMSPSPNVNHQSISRMLTRILDKYLLNKPCYLFTAPIDVFLGQNNTTVVQPDLIIVCDSNKIRLQGCFGSPDLVIEILSPGNTRKEMDYKYQLYEESGVKEYWIVYPNERSLHIYVNSDNQFKAQRPYAEGMICTSITFPELSFNVSEVFEGMLPE